MSSAWTAPSGAVASAVAVFSIEPVSTSAWETVYVAVHVVEAPGASDVVGHETGPVVGSVTARPVRLVLPLFVTSNSKRRVSFSEMSPDPSSSSFTTKRLSMSIDEFRGMGVTSGSEFETSVPLGVTAVTDARFDTTPASTWAWVTVSVA